MLSEKAALRRLILPAVLRELFLTGSALKPVVLAHCEETFYRSWLQDSTPDEVACPQRALLIQLATQRECSVTSTSMGCLVSLDYAYDKLAEFRVLPYTILC